jgi:hypothetical protein
MPRAALPRGLFFQKFFFERDLFRQREKLIRHLLNDPAGKH